MDFQDQKAAPAQKAERNPNNYNILKGGQVDPGSKLYQRSVAGREQLKDYLNRLWNDGVDEADVFMAGVKSLMNRGHGYVGAYLDSKNPGRTYTDNQAKAITDQVMTDEGIGEHPGARLTRPKVEDEEGNVDKEATKEARAKRKEANQGRGFGPKQAPGQKAMPVGQQRKRGKRTGSERVAKDDERRKGITDRTVYQQPVKTDTGDTELYDREQIKKALEDRMSGKATTEDVLAAYQSTYQKPLSDSPQADAERRRKRAESRDRFYTTGSGKKPEGEKKPTGGGAQSPTGGAKPSGAQPPSAPEERGAPEGEKQELTSQQVIAGKNELEGGFSREWKTFYGGQLEAAKKKGGIWDNTKQKQFDDRIKFKVRDAIDGYIEDLNDNSNGNLNTKDAQIRLRKYAIKAIGVDPFEGEDLGSPEQEQPTGAPAPAAAPQPKTAPDRQTQATDKTVLSRATQLGGKTAQAASTAPAPAPAARQPLPEERLGRGGRSRGNKPSGFTPEVGKQATDAIRQAVSEGKSPQEVVNEFNQGNLFGGIGVETGSATTNPLEDSPPDQYERFRGNPAEKFKGAQEGGRELPTAGRGQEGQGSLLKKGTMEARGDFKKGAKPKPSRPAQPGPESYEQTDLFGKDDFKSDQGGEPTPTESAPPDEAKPTESPGQKTFLSKAKGKETQILPSAIQVPKPGQGVTDAESYTQQLNKAGIPSAKIDRAVKEMFGTKSKGTAKSKGSKTINSAEYQEFAQSVRSMMR